MKSVSLAVIGGGPAGLSAAIAAAQAGVRVTLLDEAPSPGGQLRSRVAPVDRPDGGTVPADQLARELVEQATSAGAKIMSDARVWAIFPDRVLAIEHGERSWLLHADRVVVATGSIDIPVPFPGWTLPGVLTARAVQELLHVHCVLPGRRFAVVGSGLVADAIAEEVLSAGGEVVTRVEPREMIEHGSVEGDMGVVALIVGDVRVAVDTVVIAAGRQPDAQLALMAGCATTFDPEHCAWAPARDGLLQTTVPGMFVAGDAVAPRDVPVAMAEGRVAGLAAAASLGDPADEALATALASLQAASARAGTPTERLPAATRGILCRCEGVNAEAVRQAIAAGALTVNDVKRRTRSGMGLCQGTFCLPQIARLLQQEAGIEGTLAPMTSRPPARPISLAVLAATEL